LLFKRHGIGTEGPKEPVGRSLRQTIEARVLDRYAAPHVVANREGDVIYYSAGTGKYLGGSSGPAQSLFGRDGAQGPASAAALRSA